MYAVAVTILFQDGKLGELKDFFENSGFPALEKLKGDMYSIAFFNPKDNVNLGIAFMKDKETAEKFAEIRNENLLQIKDILTSFPRVYEGELITGKTLQDSLVDNPIDSMFLAFAILDVKNVDEYMDVQKEIYLPKLEQDEGIISYGAFKSEPYLKFIVGVLIPKNHRAFYYLLDIQNLLTPVLVFLLEALFCYSNKTLVNLLVYWMVVMGKLKFYKGYHFLIQ